jgi:hypothetical protein
MITWVALATVLSVALAAPAAARPIEVSAVDALVGDWDRFGELEALGPEILPILVDLYEKSPYPARRRTLANVFYRLGWESGEAKRVLCRPRRLDRELRTPCWRRWPRLGRRRRAERLLAIMRGDRARACAARPASRSRTIRRTSRPSRSCGCSPR